MFVVAVQVMRYGCHIVWSARGIVSRQYLPRRRAESGVLLTHGGHAWALAPLDVARWRALVQSWGLVGPLAQRHGGDEPSSVGAGQVAVGEGVRMAVGVCGGWRV